jgi:penicillin-binding protein 1A
LTKDEILEIYLASVRFDRGVNGLVSAIKHFFRANANERLSAAQCFFLVERISNVKSNVLTDKIAATIRNMLTLKVLHTADASETRELYTDFVNRGLLRPQDSARFWAWAKE